MQSLTSSLLISSVFATLTTAHAPSYHHQKCSTLSHHPKVKHSTAKFLNSTYYPQNSLNVSNTFNTIPFCEIYGSVPYGSNDTLTFALWLPDTSTYHDRFLAVGNGGMAGIIDYAGMITQLNSGLGVAVAGGNSGHSATANNDGSGAPGVYLPYLHDPDQVNAWIHNAISLFTPTAKKWVEAYYGRRPRKSYYYGCSTGGAQGFALAERWPGLFDGVFAGSPGNWYSHLALGFLWNAWVANTTESKLTQAELKFMTNAVLDACDEIDGIKDRLIENPLKCSFDIDNLACNTSSQSSSQPTCLTPSKLATAKAIYAGPKRTDTNAQIYPGFTLGSEIEWALQEGPLASAFSIPILQNLVFNNLSYNSSSFNWASNVDAVDLKAGTYIDEISTNLTAFHAHGGKLLVSQGWADPYNAATWPIEHLADVQEFFGSDNVSDWYRLFMVPGGGHCGAATYYPHVPAEYHILPKLVKWVEQGEAPKSVLSSGAPDGTNRTRKLCGWPTVARLRAGGDRDDAGGYECV